MLPEQTVSLKPANHIGSIHEMENPDSSPEP